MSGPIWRTSRFAIDLARPRVMGIVNVTPDSFSEGGAALSTAQAIARCEQMLAEGADILDIGGESSRPGALPVSAEEELARVRPVLAAAVGLGCPGLDRHDQGRGHARRARSRRRHRQRHRCVANAGRDRTRRRASELRRLPDAHARHAAIDAGRGGLRRRRRARSWRSCASGSTRREAAGIGRERIVVDPGHRLRQDAGAEPRAAGAPGSAPGARRAASSSAGRASRRWRASPAWRRKRRPAVRPTEQARLEAASVVAAVLAVQRGARIVRVHDVAATVAGLAVWQAAHDADNRADVSSDRASTP